jgi:uncharacterized protein (TIGR02453 family)
MSERFEGFGEAALEFYEGLAADNSRTYWQAHREVYERAVAAPLAALAEELEPEFGGVKIFRPNRDLRFSADKRPYKEHASLVAGYDVAHPGSGLYLSLSRTGLVLGGGYHEPARDQLDRFRQLQDDAEVAADLDQTLHSLASAGFRLMEEGSLKTAPRGWPRDHPRLDLLRLTHLVVIAYHEPAAWLVERRCLDVVRDGWRTVSTWNSWLERHVGPSTQPAPEGPHR